MSYEDFIPTPTCLIGPKLELAELSSGDVIYDLGCGDGRVLIAAAQRFAVRGVGVEVREELVTAAREEIAEQGLAGQIEIRQEDYRATDLAEADVVMIYLNRGSLGQLSLKLEQELRPGTRVVTHTFDLPAWTEERQVEVLTPDGAIEQLYLYRQGAEKEATDCPPAI